MLYLTIQLLLNPSHLADERLDFFERLRTVYRERWNDRQEIKVVNQPVGFRTFHSGTRLMRVRKRDWVVNAPLG